MTSTLSSSRRQQIEDTLADPPSVHDGAPGGVWGATRDCYEFIASELPDGAVTLETGLGISTVLFSMWSSRHTCVVGSPQQVTRLRAWANERRHDLDRVAFQVGTSDLVLPRLETEPIDFYLIDGGHGFPHPAIDWYYGSLHLRPGGVVVIDDIQLPSVHDYLLRFLDADKRWIPLGGDHKWRAFRKDGDFSVREEWTAQGFLGSPRLPLKMRAKIAINRRFARFRG